MKKINKYIEFFMTKLKVVIHEKKYMYENINVKYMFEKNYSDTLIVILSACTREGVKARYNYNRTLKEYKVNKLFILDDFGPDKRGTFYLGKNGDFSIPKAINKLIDEKINEINCKNIIFVGSSKGGAAALYYGLQRENSNIIVGAPQYYLGNYMNKKHHMERFKYIVGKVNDDSIHMLNSLIPDNIRKAKNTKIYLQYSKSDSYYDTDIKHLVNDLNISNLEFYNEEVNYKNHSDVTLFFPKFLKENLERVMSN